MLTKRIIHETMLLKREAILKLNHRKIKTELRRRGIWTSDLAKRWGISWHLARYAIHNGGLSYADRFAKLFRCKRTDLITGLKK